MSTWETLIIGNGGNEMKLSKKIYVVDVIRFIMLVLLPVAVVSIGLCFESYYIGLVLVPVVWFLGWAVLSAIKSIVLEQLEELNFELQRERK